MERRGKPIPPFGCTLWHSPILRAGYSAAAEWDSDAVLESTCAYSGVGTRSFLPQRAATAGSPLCARTAVEVHCLSWVGRLRAPRERLGIRVASAPSTTQARPEQWLAGCRAAAIRPFASPPAVAVRERSLLAPRCVSSHRQQGRHSTP